MKIIDWVIYEMKKWIFFDVMGVVFTAGDDTNDLLVPFVRAINPQISVERINDLYLDASIGSISSLKFWSQMEFCNHDCSEIEHKYLDSKLTLDEYIPKIFQELSQYYNLGLLSNDLSEWSRYLRVKFDLDKYLQCSIISADVKCRKPQKQIYEIALRQAKCLPEDCIFIDDRVKNLYPALDLGMSVIKFNQEEPFDSRLNLLQTSSISDIPLLVDSIFNNKN